MHIFKKNEVYLEIKNLEENQKKELLDFFTFEVPNAKFMPVVRNRMWDGKIRLFSPATGQIYVGLLPYIKQFCDNTGIKYIIEKGIENERNVAQRLPNRCYSTRNF